MTPKERFFKKGVHSYPASAHDEGIWYNDDSRECGDKPYYFIAAGSVSLVRTNTRRPEGQIVLYLRARGRKK